MTIAGGCNQPGPIKHPLTAVGMPLADRVALNKTTFSVTTRPYMLGQVQGTLSLCFNARQQVDLRDCRREEIVNAQQRSLDGKTIKAGLQKHFDRQGKLKSDVLEQAEEFDGYSCIFSTHPLDKNDLVHIYFDKDLVVQNIDFSMKPEALMPWLAFAGENYSE